MIFRFGSSFFPIWMKPSRFNTVKQLDEPKMKFETFSLLLLLSLHESSSWRLLVSRQTNKDVDADKEQTPNTLKSVLFALIFSFSCCYCCCWWWWLAYIQISVPFFGVVLHNFTQWFIHRDRHNPVKIWSGFIWRRTHREIETDNGVCIIIYTLPRQISAHSIINLI